MTGKEGQPLLTTYLRSSKQAFSTQQSSIDLSCIAATNKSLTLVTSIPIVFGISGIICFPLPAKNSTMYIINKLEL